MKLQRTGPRPVVDMLAGWNDVWSLTSYYEDVFQEHQIGETDPEELKTYLVRMASSRFEKSLKSVQNLPMGAQHAMATNSSLLGSVCNLLLVQVALKDPGDNSS